MAAQVLAENMNFMIFEKLFINLENTALQFIYFQSDFKTCMF